MEIPADITLATLKGAWTLDSTHSQGMDEVLKLQGVGWLTRKAISTASLTLRFTSTVEGDTTRLSMTQTLTGGIGGSTEERIMDWTERERSNHIYGDTLTRSKFINGVANAEGSVMPEVALESKPDSKAVEDELQKFLTAGTPYLAGRDGSDGWKDLYIHDFGRNEKAGWTAEQVWAFEVIDSQPYLVRRVAVVKGDTCEKARLVYKLTGM